MEDMASILCFWVCEQKSVERLRIPGLRGSWVALIFGFLLPPHGLRVFPGLTVPNTHRQLTGLPLVSALKRGYLSYPA
jgi:hypothetical protein